MPFQIHALPKAPFETLFELSDQALKAQGACRVTADSNPGFPCRVSLQDAEPGETLILTNYRHLNGPTPLCGQPRDLRPAIRNPSRTEARQSPNGPVLTPLIHPRL